MAIDRTTITLNQAGDNKESCQPNDVGMLAQRQGNPVRWDIVNNCSDAYFVTVDNFKLRDPQNGNAPANQSTLVLDENRPTVQVQGKGGTATITAHLHKGAPYGVYKYEIYRSPDGQSNWKMVLDPDVEPWP